MGDWGGYGRIIEEAHEMDREQRGKPPSACPVCGTALEYNERRGQLNCPLGHYRVQGRPAQS
jgi:NAD-dependent DNA ligase